MCALVNVIKYIWWGYDSALKDIRYPRDKLLKLFKPGSGKSCCYLTFNFTMAWLKENFRGIWPTRWFISVSVRRIRPSDSFRNNSSNIETTNPSFDKKFKKMKLMGLSKLRSSKKGGQSWFTIRPSPDILCKFKFNGLQTNKFSNFSTPEVYNGQ